MKSSRSTSLIGRIGDARTNIIPLSLGLGVLFWIVDTVIDSFFFYDRSFFDLLIWDVPGHEVYIRIVAVLLFLAFGLVVSRLRCECAESESSLQLEKELMEESLNAQLDIFCIFEPETRKAVRWNTAFENVIQYSADEIASLPAPDAYLDEEDLVKASLAVRDAITEGRGYAEINLIAKSGKRIPFEFRGSSVEEAATGRMLIVAVGRDLSEREKTEQALRESERKYRSVFAQAPIGIFQSTPEGRYLMVNPIFAEMAGYSSPIEMVEDVRDISFLYADPRKRSEVVQLLKESGVLSGHEINVRRIDGEHIWASAYVKAVFDQSGKVLYFDGFLLDITERKKAEQALKEREAELNRAQRVAQIGSWRVDMGTGRAFASPESIRIYGFGSKPLTIKEIQRAPLPEYRETLDQALADLIKGTHPYRVEFKIKRPTDDRVVDILSIAEYDAQTETVIGTIQDITDRRAGESEREELEQQLRQSQKMEAVGRLAGGVAHDFNNILTAIQGFADLLMSELDQDSQAMRDVEEISKASQTAARLTHQLLAFSRKQIIAPKVLVLNDVIEHAQKMLVRLIGEDVELLFEPSDDLWRIRFDPGQIDQILVNLAVNSRDAMPNGGRITIRTSNIFVNEGDTPMHIPMLAGEYVALSFTDDGSGMDFETQKNIFEPFFSTKEKGKGTGLGLSTVYGIVKQNRGSISVDSLLEEGTTFTFYIPRTTAEPTWIDRIADKRDMTGTETVLIAEDQEMVRTLAERVLNSQGYDILTAVDGADALRIAKDHAGKIDLLLTDVVMPNMSGKELYEKMEPSVQGLRVLYMSGYTEDAVAHHGVLEEGVNFIQKPFRSKDLTQMVRAALDEGKLPA
jgi:PAS domain S-box-containing protein